MNANYETKRRIEMYWERMTRLGLDTNRLQLAWISAAEGDKFASKATEMHQFLCTVKKEEIEKAASLLSHV